MGSRGFLEIGDSFPAAALVFASGEFQLDIGTFPPGLAVSSRKGMKGYQTVGNSKEFWPESKEG
jgi:hypothetical protein